MNQVLTDAWRTLVPASDDKHGPLVPMMVGLTVVTGLVDAFSYLALGHVFVANMTGNVIFLAFALVGARGFSFLASLAAIAAFSCGALVGGRVSARIGHNRGHHLVVVTSLEAVLVGASAVLAGLAHTPGVGCAALPPYRAAERRLGDAERRRTQAGHSRPHHHGAHPHHHRHLSRQPTGGRWWFESGSPAGLGPGHVCRCAHRRPSRSQARPGGADAGGPRGVVAIVVTMALLSRSEPGWVHPPA